MAHLVGYIANTVEYKLVFLNSGDSWDELFVDFASDSDFNVPKSTGGMYLQLSGPNGSQYPMDWGSRRLHVQTTNSGESEAIAWGSGTKAAIRLAAMVEYTRSNPCEIAAAWTIRRWSGL